MEDTAKSVTICVIYFRLLPKLCYLFLIGWGRDGSAVPDFDDGGRWSYLVWILRPVWEGRCQRWRD